MSHLNNLKSVMISLAAEHKLPEIYQDDITTDVESLCCGQVFLDTPIRW